MEQKEWFADWFDSPYYPILYQHRDFTEAEQFIRNLVLDLNPAPDAHFLDLACGRGRHSRFLNQLGYRVTGLDLSPESIEDAREWQNESLDFGVHDMRKPFPGTFTHILNLFTSFGYFDDFSQNVTVLENIAQALTPHGIFVMDFLNPTATIRQLVPAETKIIQDIRFEIRREAINGFILKHIHIDDHGKQFDFSERVQALDKELLVEMAQQKGLQFYKAWGDYQGTPWEDSSSSRMILFFRT